MTQYHSLAAATRSHSVSATIARMGERVLEGSHPWGSIDVTPTGRTTWNRTRLTVYPPGTNHAERRALQFYRTWPVVGAVFALFTLLALSSWPPLGATAVAVAIYAAGLAAAFSATKTLRPRLRRLTVVTVPLGGGVETLGDVAFFELATDRFRALDRLDGLGLVTPAEYESGWSEIYAAIPAPADAEQRGFRRPA